MGKGGRAGLSLDAVVLATGCKKSMLNGSVRNIDYRLSSLLVPTTKRATEKQTSVILSKEIPLNRLTDCELSINLKTVINSHK
jgi:hypothetical protein